MKTINLKLTFSNDNEADLMLDKLSLILQTISKEIKAQKRKESQPKKALNRA